MQWLRSVHMPTSFSALQRRASGDQGQRQQQKHTDQCQKQDIHFISRDFTRHALSQRSKLGPRAEKQGSICGRLCKSGVNAGVLSTGRLVGRVG